VASSGSSVVGGIIDNILTTAMIPVVKDIQAGSGDNAYWWAPLARRLFPRQPDLVWPPPTRRRRDNRPPGQPIGFWAFLKIGLPVTDLDRAATVYILARYEPCRCRPNKLTLRR
jgi:hypothetical protein